MKVIVEFDLPEGQAIPDPRDIVRLTSPDWICHWGHFSDVQEGKCKEDLTEYEAREVLCLMDKYADCNVGINWDSIDVWAEMVREDREENEDA